MPSISKYCFGDFELDLDASQLRLRGNPVKLERRPMDLLVLLVTRHGRMVSREEIVTAIWPAEIIIDFNTGLNTLVRKIRDALGDSSTKPRFVETVPGRGYRFIAPVVALPVSEPPPEQAAMRRRTPWLRLHNVAALLLLAGVIAYLWRAGNLSPEPTFEADGEGPTLRSESETTRGDLSARTLAVLPFRTSASDEASTLLAHSVTELIRDRLAALDDLTVVASSSTLGFSDAVSDTRVVGERLHANLLLTGDTNRAGDRLFVNVQLVDIQSAEELWSAAFDKPLNEVATIREEILQQIAILLRVPIDITSDDRLANNEISLDAYLLYIRGQQLLANSTMADAERAVELFRRATILDPGFSKAYLGLGQAMLGRDANAVPLVRLAPLGDARKEAAPEVQAQAARAFARALELSPTLGEAWVEKARLAGDSTEAEEFYRKGLDLAPNYGTGYVHYADFLFREGRAGEAIGTISRARRIDPLTPELHLIQAFFLMVARSDVDGHDRLIQEALEINPRLPSALHQLAHSRWEYSGEFADAAQLVEKAISVAPELPRSLARDIYLDLGDPVAAVTILDGSPPSAAMEIAQYDGDRLGAAALLKYMSPEDLQDTGPRASMSEAIRDGAIASNDFQPSLRLLESVYALRARESPMWHRGSWLVYAHMLTLAGDVERGRQLAESTLLLLETHSVGRAENYFSRERAAAYAVLGEDERVLEELAISVTNGKLYRWWYLAGYDPLYEHLRLDPRFHAINELAQQYLDQQKSLLEEMRRNGEVPMRNVGATP